MACIGSKTIQKSKSKNKATFEMNQMTVEENKSSKHRRKKNSKSDSIAKKEHPRKVNKISSNQIPQSSFLRKNVDPETAKYFSEIATLFEGKQIEFNERSVISGNALEETKGKEVELATDIIISRTLQSLLEACDVDHLCSFLLNGAEHFPSISIDKSGSHVAETALKSLAKYLEDNESYPTIEYTLTKICEEVVSNSVNMMCSRYGSHVLRSLLCFCKGIPLDSEEFHSTKTSIILSERLSTKLSQSRIWDLANIQTKFPHLLKLLVEGMLKYAKDNVTMLVIDKHSSFVLQTVLKLLVGDDMLMHVIPLLLGSHAEKVEEGKFIEDASVQCIIDLLEDTSFSHLMEVILEVAPEPLYNELFAKLFRNSLFRNSLFRISSHQCGNFVVQALISSTRCLDQLELILEELGTKFRELMKSGKSGVIASILAACHRLHANECKCIQSLTSAVCVESESLGSIVPRLLHLESYFSCPERFNWKWMKGDKTHFLGCLILQTIFKFQNELIQSYTTSITSMEHDHLFEVTKDASGSRVVEAFLCSNASSKQKHKIIAKLCGHFGELAVHTSGSFTVEKCFTFGTALLKECIASELLSVRDDLSKKKQGPYLLKKLDIDGFSKRPDQWRLRQAAKLSAYNEFHATFSSKTLPEKEKFCKPIPSQCSFHKSQDKEINLQNDTSDPIQSLNSEFPGLEDSMENLGISLKKRPFGIDETDFRSKKKTKQGNDNFPGKKDKRKERSYNIAVGIENGVLKSPSPSEATQMKEKKRITADDFLSKPFQKKQRTDDFLSKPFQKKQRANDFLSKPFQKRQKW